MWKYCFWTVTQLKTNKYLLLVSMGMCVCLVCVCPPHVQGPLEIRREHLIPWNWNYWSCRLQILCRSGVCSYWWPTSLAPVVRFLLYPLCFVIHCECATRNLESQRVFTVAENSKANTHFTPEINIFSWDSEQEMKLRDLRIFTEDSFFFKDLFLLFVILCT